ncbi:MAG: autotransporter outer membrane beta-barrel domain-containing protein [Gammaproteobacteria bacterium]|nr:autotransporter outer membrane beta-barrel domain-containing protein [Gammaproteobacteria bacterium]
MAVTIIKANRFIIAVMLSLIWFPIDVHAQEFNEIQVIIKPQLNIEQSRRIRQIVRDIGGKRLASAMSGGEAFSPTTETAIYGLGLVDTAVYDLSPVDTAAYGLNAVEKLTTPETAGWNIWLDGSAGKLESTAAFSGYEGDQLSVSLGADTTLNDVLTLGVLLNHSASDITNDFVPGGSTTDSVGVGPYMALFLSDTTVFTGSFLYTWTGNGADSGGITADYHSQSWALNGSLANYHQIDNWMIAPSVGVSLNTERDAAYKDSGATAYAASTTRTGSLTIGGTINYTHLLDNGMTIQPSLSAEGEWTFLRSVDADTSGGSDTDDFDVNITIGSDFQLSDAVSLSLTSTVSGLAMPDYSSIAVAGRLSFSF